MHDVTGGEVDEEVLADGLAPFEDGAVEWGGVEAPLRGRDRDRATAEGPRQGVGEAMDDVTLGHRPRLARGYHALMTEEHPREFGRDGVSGLVDRARAIRARLLPRRTAPRDERRPPAAPGRN